jgi:transcriptional regulator with XRE-family HTH domain
MGKPASYVMAFADNLRRLMEREQLSQAALAQRSGVAQRTLSTWLDTADPASINPRAQMVEKVAAAFRVPAWMLFMPTMPTDPAAIAEWAALGRTSFSPSRSDDNSLQSLDSASLRLAVTAVAEGLRRANSTVPPAVLAEMVEAAYDMLAGAKDPEAMRPQVVRMVSIQGGKQR